MIDPLQASQLIFFVIDKSNSMNAIFDQNLSRFQVAQKLSMRFTQSCYKYRITSLYGSILFNENIEVRNSLNPLPNNFLERMINPNDRPEGRARIFSAIRRGAELLLDENRNNHYPNAVLRLVIISTSEEICSKQEEAEVFNLILQNNIRIDSIFLSTPISRELVSISRLSGGSAISIQNHDEGLNFFMREDFFNPKIRKFNQIDSPIIDLNYLQSLSPLNENDLDEGIEMKPNEFADPNLIVTTPANAISNQQQQQQHNNLRIINELRIIVENPIENVIVFPLKIRIDVWRVLLKGQENSHYAGKWFYMIIEFPQYYPQNYPSFRFVKPPFHPNINDQGKVMINELINLYRSEMHVNEILEIIKNKLTNPDFDSCVDLKREKIKRNQSELLEKINEFNERNGRNSPEDFERDWKIQ